MSEFVRIGQRFVNLENIAEVRVNPQMRTAYIFYAGGGTMELRDEDADDLLALLDRRAQQAEESHARVFAPLPG